MLKLWNWLDGKKASIGIIASVVLSILARRGVVVPDWVFDITDGVLGLGLAHKAVKAVGAKAAAGVAALLLAGLAVGGCQALGLTPQATAPAYSGVGVLVVGSENDAKLYSKGDQSGATGASGSASQSLEIPQETVDALLSAAQELIKAGNPAAAAGILDAIKGAHDAKKSAPKAPEVKPVPAPASAPPSAAVTPPAPETVK